MELKDRLKTAREYAGLSQAAVSDEIGMSQASYHKLESGKSQTSRKLLNIALALKVDPKWLATGRGEMVPTGADAEPRETIQLDFDKWAILALAVDRLTADIRHNTYNDTPETLERLSTATVEIKQLLNECQIRNGYTI